MDATTATTPPPERTTPRAHAPGIYIGLPADEYHGDEALGSTDIRALRRGIKFVHQDTPATVLGTAMHMLVLDGRDAFNAAYHRRPGEYADMSTGDKSKMTKALKAEYPFMEILPAEDYDLCVDSLKIIDGNPDLAGCMLGGLSEVSVFWERDGFRLKCRFDKLKLNGVGDLKTIANERHKNLEEACLYDIKYRQYGMQAAHYLDGRSRLPALLKNGCVYDGATGEALSRKDGPKAVLDYLDKVAAKGGNSAFQFVFLQKEPPATTWSTFFDSTDPLIELWRDHVDSALARYPAHLDKFHAPGGWSTIEPVRKVVMSDFPGGEFGW